MICGRRKTSLLVMILFMAFPVFSMADSIDVEKLTDSCVVGESLYFKITVHLDDEKEIDVSQVILNGTPLSYEENQSASSSFSFTINGRTIQQSSGLEKSFVFQVPGEKEGTLTVPSAMIKVGDQSFRMDSLTFTVHPRPVSDNFRLVAALTNPLPMYYPTQTIEVVYKLYFKDFQGSPQDLQYKIPELSHPDFSLAPDTQPVQGYVIINDQKFGISYDQKNETLDGKEYNCFVFKLKFRLMKPGQYSFVHSVKALVETGRVIRQRGFFGTELVRERGYVYAESSPLDMQVRELPTKNVPEGYNGAIGDFTIKVIPSSDTNIKVGDPITLVIEISGMGSWEFVKCPPVAKMPGLTDYFIISGDPVAGEVSTDGTQKSFTVRMRAKSKTITQIPPIPFTFFNIAKQAYVTVYSDPVPISVFDATGNVEVVDYGKPPLPDDKGASPDMAKKPSASDPKTSESSQAPATPKADLPELIPIRDNVAGDLLIDNHAPEYHRILFALIPLFLIALTHIVQKIRRIRPSDKQLARIRERSAYRIFVAAISHLEKRDPDETIFYRDLGQQMLHFIENRFLIKAEEVEAALIDTLVAQKKISQETGKMVMNIYERVQHLRYSKEPFNPREARSIVKNVKEVLKKC